MKKKLSLFIVALLPVIAMAQTAAVKQTDLEHVWKFDSAYNGKMKVDPLEITKSGTITFEASGKFIDSDTLNNPLPGKWKYDATTNEILISYPDEAETLHLTILQSTKDKLVIQFPFEEGDRVKMFLSRAD